MELENVINVLYLKLHFKKKICKKGETKLQNSHT